MAKDTGDGPMQMSFEPRSMVPTTWQHLGELTNICDLLISLANK